MFDVGKMTKIFFFFALLLESGKFLLRPFSTLVLHMVRPSIPGHFRTMIQKGTCFFIVQMSSSIYQPSASLCSVMIYFGPHNQAARSTFHVSKSRLSRSRSVQISKVRDVTFCNLAIFSPFPPNRSRSCFHTHSHARMYCAILFIVI